MGFPVSFLKTFFIVIFPALMSINSITTWDTEKSESWLKYWVVLSFSLPLEMISNRWKGVKVDILKIVFVCWCLAPIQYNGCDMVFDYLLCPLYKTSDKILFEIAKMAAPFLIRCIKVTKSIKGDLPEIVELCSYRFKETLDILIGTVKQMIDLWMSKSIEQEVKPRLLSDIYKDFKKSL